MKTGSFMRPLLKTMALGATMFLAACATQPLDTFTLQPNSVQAQNSGRNLSRTQLLIANPNALKALDGQDIVISGSAGSIAYLKGAQWSDRLPNVVQARLIQLFEDSGRLGGVGRPGDGLAINYQLITDIRRFGIELQGSGRIAVVEIAVKVMNDRSGNVRATQVFQAMVPVQGTSNAEYVIAIDQAFARVGADIVNWSLKHM